MYGFTCGVLFVSLRIIVTMAISMFTNINIFAYLTSMGTLCLNQITRMELLILVELKPQYPVFTLVSYIQSAATGGQCNERLALCQQMRLFVNIMLL